MSRSVEVDTLLLRIDCHGTNKFGMLDEDIRDFVRKTPTADVAEVKHGKWIHASVDMGFFRFRCSECGLDDVYDEEREQYRYCPNCGARMDGDRK